MDTDGKQELFENTPVSKALATLAVPTIISQLINLVYNMVDAFFIGRTGDSYKTAAVTLAFTIFLMTIAFANLFGIGGGSLIARLIGKHETEHARKVSVFSIYGAICVGLLYSLIIGLFLDPILWLLGASDNTIGYAHQYLICVIVFGSTPTILTMTLGHLLRNVGYSKQASIGMSSGGILNMILDPLFMFVLLPDGMEVLGAALATLISNCFSCIYLFIMLKRVSKTAPLSMNPKELKGIRRSDVKELFSVGVPSAILTGLFDVANIFLNSLMATHGDLPLAAIGIVMKAERLPTAINIGICQAMMPMVAYNYSSGNLARMNECIKKSRIIGLVVSFSCIVLFEIFANPISRLFMSASGGHPEEALATIAYSALFLRYRCVASPVQLLNYQTSYCLQALGDGRDTLIHSVVRQLVFYIPLMYLFDSLFDATGLSFTVFVSELLGGLFALFLLNRRLKKLNLKLSAKTV